MSAPDHGPLRDLAAAYVLGVLEPEEARAFERVLAGSPELQHQVAEYREVNALLAAAAQPVAPDTTLRARVLERVARERRSPEPLSSRRRSTWATGLAWAAALAGLIAAGGFWLEARSTKSELATLTRQLDSLSARLAWRESTLNAILEPGTVLFALTSPMDPQPGIQVFWNRKANLWVLHAFNLRPAPSGRAYQLWFLKDGQALPSTTFNSEPDGHALVTVPGPQAGITGAAVTEEPAAGSPQPTSTPILVGALPAN